MPLDFKIRYSYENQMGVSINGVNYIYHLDGGHALNIMRLYNLSPGKALQLLKKVSYHYEKEPTSTIPKSKAPEPKRSSYTKLSSRG